MNSGKTQNFDENQTVNVTLVKTVFIILTG